MISIHALREEGDGSAGIGGGIELISIHALREEGDACRAFLRLRTGKFQSTPSARRATVLAGGALRHRVISIHALREESDFIKLKVL